MDASDVAKIDGEITICVGGMLEAAEDWVFGGWISDMISGCGVCARKKRISNPQNGVYRRKYVKRPNRQ